jgi:putative phage-type endonuclease
MEQRSDDWLEWRRKGLGASDAPAVMGVSPWTTAYQLWEEKTGRKVRDYSNWATNRGNILEPKARALVEFETGMEFPAVLFEHRELPFMRASLDGYNAENQIALEIKCPGKDDHAKALAGEIPEKYFPQLMHQIFVTGAKQAYYYSYDGESGCLVKVEPDHDYIKELVKKMMHFWVCIRDDKEPELTERDYKLIRDKSLFEKLQSWKEASENVKILQNNVDALKAEILSHEKVKGIRSRCGGFKISVTSRKGTIDYKKVPELMGVDLERYRGKPSTFQTISFKEDDNA